MFIAEREVLAAGEQVLVAVSGGGDSTAMLLILSRLASEFGWRLTVAHFDHRLRTREEARADREFVAGLAESLKLPFVHGSGDVARRARTRGDSVEQAARTLRYRFLGARAKAAGAGVVVVGHTLDDQAETVLMHLIRGSGLDGLAAMRPRSGWPLGRGPEVARPLLMLRREETLRYCRESRVASREDATNQMLLATRNRIRHEVLPTLRALNPSVDEALARLAETVYEDTAELERQAEVAFARVGRRERELVALKLSELSELSLAIQRRVLRLAMADVLGSRADVESAHVEAVSRLVVSRPGRVSLPRGLVAVRNSQMLTVRRGEPAMTAPIPETELAVPGVTDAGGWRFEVEYVSCRPGRQLAGSEVYLSCEAAREGLMARSRRPGDRMRPVGLGGTKKLQDIFVDAKVPSGERDGVPVLVAGGRVAWVVGLCVDERAEASAGGPCVRIRALKRTPNT